MTEVEAAYPVSCDTLGKKVEYVSKVLLPAKRFDEYVTLMGQVLDEDVHYVDPVHELRGKKDVLTMLAVYVPRAANEHFEFELLVDQPTQLVWRWKMVITLRFGGYVFVINGLVHAEVKDGVIVYQREYYDPMQSIGVIPLVGRLYKRMLMLG